MTNDDGADDVFFLEEKKVRLEFEFTGTRIWIGLVMLLGLRRDSPSHGHVEASRLVRLLSDLAKLRCRPDGRPLPAATALECLLRHISWSGESLERIVASYLLRDLAGRPRSKRTPAEVATMAEAFLRCFTAGCERGELTWVDELYAMVKEDGPTANWTLEVPAGPLEQGATVVLRIPVAALEAADLQHGDRLILEPRPGGLWIGRARRIDDR
jgi:hypothetical protein